MKRRSSASPLHPLTRPLTMQYRRQEGGRRLRLLFHKLPLFELRRRRRLQTYGGRMRLEMEKAIAASFPKLRQSQEARRPQPQVAAPRCGRSPQIHTTINP